METGASKSFMAECEVLRKVRHRNLLKVLTVCSSVDFEGNDFKALVFEFMQNGSVEDWLHPRSDSVLPPRHLNLWQILNIAIDVASALDYLHSHCETPIVHCDLKSSNILLDDDMAASVGDFGLAKFLRKTASGSGTNESNSIAVRGTIGYIPPEYGMGAQVSMQAESVVERMEIKDVLPQMHAIKKKFARMAKSIAREFRYKEKIWGRKSSLFSGF
ncbi:Receptor kinase-like protein xa21 [Thalictrum thalictroides]|uniref:Receptor kinase-like protein xa21 n=1 Tax=Thalictrum thalictroides TaxID=46969 RepID=A0A7J6W8S6_THATH|nr:Receptor kinase-like protein xa21 [Thalictrum thalictroides]